MLIRDYTTSRTDNWRIESESHFKKNEESFMDL